MSQRRLSPLKMMMQLNFLKHIFQNNNFKLARISEQGI